MNAHHVPGISALHELPNLTLTETLWGGLLQFYKWRIWVLEKLRILPKTKRLEVAEVEFPVTSF